MRMLPALADTHYWHWLHENAAAHNVKNGAHGHASAEHYMLTDGVTSPLKHSTSLVLQLLNRTK